MKWSISSSKRKTFPKNVSQKEKSINKKAFTVKSRLAILPIRVQPENTGLNRHFQELIADSSSLRLDDSMAPEGFKFSFFQAHVQSPLSRDF